MASPAFGPLWSSPPFHSVPLDGQTYAPHLYATPLYVDRVPITAGPHAGRTPSVVVAASSNGWVYAVNAFPVDCAGAAIPPGTVLWQTRLGTPAVVPGLDGGVPLGVLGTPAIDLEGEPPRLYVAAVDASAGWQVFALGLGDGQVLPGWPLSLDEGALARVNRNGPTRFAAATEMPQRAALALGPRGDVLYVAFGTFRGVGPGWMVAIDTRRAVILSAFASAPRSVGVSSGGMWGAGGPAVDGEGRVYMTTGNSPGAAGDAPRVWGSSLLEWSSDLRLTGTYTPFNFCRLDRGNLDLGTPLVLPDLDPSTTATPRLIAFGGKQGTVYLVARDRLAGGVDRRPPCRTDAASDGSLLPPHPQPQFGAPGPLLVFGPYTVEHAQLDHARMRTTPVYYRDASGTSYLFVSGATKAAADSPVSVPPSLVRLRVVTQPGAPAYLAVDRQAGRPALQNPGSPVVTSNGPADAVVWVLDPDMPRLAPLVGPSVRRPVLYAFDGATLALLWRSAPGALEVGGKYSSPTVAHGVVFVGTDRIQAFGLRNR